jgi:HlyD family secretion protein
VVRPSARRWGAATGVALVLVLGFLTFRPAPVRVDTARVERGRMRVSVDEEGRTRVRDRFTIAAPIAGRLARIVLDAGDPVQRGTVVARMQPLPLDPRSRAEAVAHLDAAEAAWHEADVRVEHARAAFNQAQRSATRARQLGAAGTIGKEERELAELAETARQKELDAATFAAQAAAYNLEAARAALMAPDNQDNQAMVAACETQPRGCLELRSPVDGQVLKVMEESERVVALGTPLLELGDTHALEVVVDVLSADAVQIKPGALMQIEEWGGKQPLQAHVRLVEPSAFTKVSALGVEEQRVNVVGDFVTAPAPLADGYRVEARIVVWEAEDVVKVPTSALFRRDGAWNVFVVDGGRARRRTLHTGRRSALEAQVLDGLNEGDVVIVHPSDQVDEGVRVAPL